MYGLGISISTAVNANVFTALMVIKWEKAKVCSHKI
jgi:hypothetical protein